MGLILLSIAIASTLLVAKLRTNRTSNTDPPAAESKIP